MGQSHWVHGEKGPEEAVFPPPAEEVQPATGAPETVILCHHRNCPVFIYNCLVWFSYQNRHQKITTDSQDCWEDYQCPSAQPPITLHLQSEEKGKESHSGPLTPSSLSLWTVALWLALQSTEHQNSQTQEQFSPQATWTTHKTPQYCTSVNNSSNLHLYIGHMHIHSSVHGHFYFPYIDILLLLLFINIIYSLNY